MINIPKPIHQKTSPPLIKNGTRQNNVNQTGLERNFKLPGRNGR